MSPILLLGLFVLQRQWRAAAGVVGTVMGLMLIAWLGVGTQNMLSFFTIGLGESTLSELGANNNFAPLSRLHYFAQLWAFTGLEGVLRGLWVLCCLGALTLLSLRPHSPDSLAFKLLFSLWIAATLLISPVTWEGHLVMLLPAFAVCVAVLLEVEERRARWLGAWLALAYVGMAFDNWVYTHFGEWWRTTGSYVHDRFIGDLRLVSLMLFSALLVVLLRVNRSGERQTSSR